MDTELFFKDQLECSPEIAAAFEKLYQSQTRTINFNGFSYILQLNPARIKSSTADISKPLNESACFLCSNNMPTYQKKVIYDDNFFISVNPYPILNRHLTIINRRHTPQTIHNYILTMLHLAFDMQDMVVFYNSPKSGASAPFHSHFQAGLHTSLPLFVQVEEIKNLYTIQHTNDTWIVDDQTRRFVVIESPNINDAKSKAENILHQICKIYNTNEPEANIGVEYIENTYRIIILPREKHRPTEYNRTTNPILVSPGFADMAGIIPCCLTNNFIQITPSDIQSIISQVSITKEKIESIKIERNALQN